VPLLSWTGIYVGPIAWLPLSGMEAAIIGLGGAAVAVTSRLPAAPLWAALLWVADEAIRSRAPFGGLPWGKVAFSQSGGGFVSLAAVGGTPLLGFAVALTGFGVTALLLRAATSRGVTSRGGTGVRPVAWLGGALAVLVPIGGAAAAWPFIGTDANAGTAVVAAIQGNVPRLGLDFNAQRRAVLDNHVAETNRLAQRVAAGQVPQPDLVLWPENSSDIDPYVNADAYTEISQAAAAIKAPVSVGAVVTSQAPGPQNTQILWQPGQGPVDSYVKRQLQPFGETMPLRSLFRHFSADVDRAGNFVAGTKPEVFHMAQAKVAMDTCYEVAFDATVRDSISGSNLIAIPSNNATFGFSDESVQQLGMDAERAVEHGRSVVVAATSGISAIIMPDGTVTQQTGLFTAAALVARVPLRSTTTLADRLGGWPEWAMVAAGLVGLGFGVATRVRARRARRVDAAPVGAGA
jgi:apolipoprotein N-acyltransferase